MIIKILDSLRTIPAADWNALPGARVALSHEYLLALEQSGCATPETGWQLSLITVWDDARLVGALPLYFKSHSYGEFVFDWAWANAYEQHGLDYYPKLVSCAPFTPVGGPRILAAAPEVRTLLIQAALQLTRETKVSSLHVLFPPEEEARELEAQGLNLRQGVQFHWHNEGYRDFEQFLSGMRHDKRKKIHQERRKVREAGVTLRRVPGEEITEEEWAFFARCYDHTHELYGSPTSLNLDFFRRIGRTMPRNIFLVIAYRDEKMLGSALNLYDEKAAYGRSWGALEYVPGLHFEACYYQAIEFCIERGLLTYEGGAQGEHKLARGFLPTVTWSAHRLAHPQFAAAVNDFLRRETGKIEHYVDELNDSNPFKKRERA
jgi:predicted N-acyltransferase